LTNEHTSFKIDIAGAKIEKGTNGNAEDANLHNVYITATQVVANKVASFQSMEPAERAFCILVDLGLIDIHPDPESPDYDHSDDDKLA
jgi:hypothetical protein